MLTHASRVRSLHEHARRWTLLTFFLALFTSGGLAAPPPRNITLQDLDHLCPPGPSCELTIGSPWQTTLSGDTRLHRPFVLHVTRLGSWTIRGGNLDLAGSTIDAPPDLQIFPGPGSIHGLTSARPEWFTPPEQGVYPSSALALAFAAIDRTGTILLTEHIYISPFFDPTSINTCTGRTLFVDHPLTILGTRRPLPDDDHAPTRLLNGSIIRGEICGTSQLHLAHLGVDQGPYTVAHTFSGHAAYGIQVLNPGPPGAVSGTVLEDLSILTTGLPNQHSVIVEGQRHPTLKDLWIWTRGGTHGLVVKSLDSVVDNIHCTGAASDCLILKSDYDTDHAGDASGTVVSNVFIHSLQHPGDTGGIQIEGRWDSLRHLSLTNVHESGLRYGIIATDSLVHEIADLNITNWSATDTSGPCLVLNGTTRVNVTHFSCQLTNPGPSPAILLIGTHISLRDGQITCAGSTCSDPALDGVADSGHRNRLDGISGTNLGGYLVRTSPHIGGTLLDTVTTQGGSRVASVYHEAPQSLSRHLQLLVSTLKALLRIAIEKARTMLHLR